MSEDYNTIISACYNLNIDGICERLLMMKVSYNKLWKLLVDRKMSKADLRKAVKMSPNTMTKMRRDQEISMSILLKIGDYLDCDISEIMEFVKD